MNPRRFLPPLCFLLLTTGCTNLYVVSNNVNCKATRAGTQDDATKGEVTASAAAQEGSLTRVEELVRAFQSDIDCTGTSTIDVPVVEDSAPDE